MKNLIGMTDFVLEQKQSTSFIERVFVTNELLSIEKIRKYANFLKQPLELGMFVPCDEDGNVLEEPICQEYALYNKKYQKSKERCLFEGFTEQEASYIISCSDNKIIEDLVTYKPKLTPTAQKQIGL